jgi:NAD(P)-dependent dehydrogenase (short-subunit alcohol dehydrogenase family)
MPIALITGASRGLGQASVRALSARGWSVVADARGEADLTAAVGGLPGVAVVAGDVTEAAHRAQLAAETAQLAAQTGQPGRLDLLVNNASRLGPSPQPPLLRYPLAELTRVYDTNVLAPLALIQLLAGPLAAANGTVVNITSDAAVEHYPGWGGYGSAKSALDHVTGVLAAEVPALRWYSLDPGEMDTAMWAAAFPGEDAASLLPPESVVPALLRLVDERPPSGRYLAADLSTPAVTP